jgi:hypothetical protein
LHAPIDGLLQGDLDERHQAKIGGQLVTKGDSTKDLDLMFLKCGKVDFGDGALKGRWCIVCKSVFFLVNCEAYSYRVTGATQKQSLWRSFGNVF